MDAHIGRGMVRVPGSLTGVPLSSGSEVKSLGAEFGLWTVCTAQHTGHRLVHAGWAVFVNSLDTSVYSPSRHLCRSLPWLPKPQDTPH